MTTDDPIDPTVEPDQPDDGDQPGDGDQTGEPDENDDKPGSEAAKYRRRLRETEQQRDQLSQRVERFQHADVERQVADRLAQPDDLFRFGVTLADVLDGDGNVESGLVETALLGLLDARPGLAKQSVQQQRRPVPLGQGRQQQVAPGPTWSDVIRHN